MANHATYSPDGKLIAVALSDGTIRILDNETGQVILLIEGHTVQVNSVDYSPDGKRLISTAGDNTVKIWDINTGKLIHTFSFDV